MGARLHEGPEAIESGLDMPELMTVEEFARVTRRTASAVVAAIGRGEIPAHKLGSRRWWIRRADVMKLFEGAKR
ncbi:MAG: helix-turn-helix domain-containing protein [Planctomycetota bacterium]|jgi:excisionase family DNA binding protein